MIRSTVQEHIFIVMEINTKVNGKMMNNMVKGNIHLKMDK